jgi:hypothetical protein
MLSPSSKIGVEAIALLFAGYVAFGQYTLGWLYHLKN